jgi:UPF0755 protein
MNKSKLVIGLFLVAVAIGGYFAFPYIKLFLAAQDKTINSEEIAFYVIQGTTVEQLQVELVEKGVLAADNSFLELANYRGLSDSLVAPGKYLIEPNYPVKHIAYGFKMNALGNGNAEVEVDVTFNNCRDLYELAGKASQHVQMDSTELVYYLTSNETVKHYGFKHSNFAAMFIPNTYKMYWDTSPEDFVVRMAEEFKTFWNDDRKRKAAQINLTQSEVVTLASIVYKEQGLVADEWPTIAGLYLNRLRDNWKLESDPTFRYCWGKALDGVQRLTYAHRDIDCPYNTYKYAGLPPGPIYIPPAAAVDAVLNAEKNNYYFMCAKPGGENKHSFAHSYTDHLRNAKAYQKWLSANKIK